MTKRSASIGGSLRTFVTPLIVLCLVACEKKPPYLQYDVATQAMSRSSTEIELPVGLFDRIEEVANSKWASFGEAEKKIEKPERKSEDLILKSKVEMVPIKVYLLEKTRGILGGQNHQLEFPKGGGEVDLRDFVRDKQGSFYLNIEFGVAPPSDAPYKIFYLSNASARKVAGETLGSGCNRYFDISSYYLKTSKNMGFLVNTTQQRDVSALIGSYFFVAKVERKRYMAAVTIKDSRYRQLQCRR